MSYTVLVLDDDADYRTMLRHHFVKRGHTLLEAATGRAATETIGAHTVDLVIVDGLLPDTDGLRWIRSLRDRGDQTSIVFVSAFFRDIESHRKLTRDLGVLRVIQKPMGQPAFVGDLVTLLEQRPPRAAKAATPAPTLARGTHDKVATRGPGVVPVALAPKVAPAAAPRPASILELDDDDLLELDDDDLLVEDPS